MMNTPVPQQMLKRAASIRLLVLDVDGVLTDGRLYLTEDGSEFKAFHVRDGLGVERLQDSGIRVALVTGRQSRLVARRADELGITEVRQGCSDKAAALRELCESMGIDLAFAAHMGDDLPDLPPMQLAGLGIAVADAHPQVIAAADWVTRRGGGQGAVREMCDLILQAGQRGPQ